MPLFFDAETDGLFSDDADDPPPNIHCICIYDSDTAEFTRFYEKEGGPMRTETVEAAATFLTTAHPQSVHGFNSAAYDLRLLYAHTACPNLKTDIASLALEHTDVMLDFWSRQGFPTSLQSLAQGIGAGSKLMNGFDAIQHWKNNNIEQVLKYCDDDCSLLAKIVEYIITYGRYIRVQKSSVKTSVTVVENYSLRTVISAIQKAQNVDTSWMKTPPKINVDWALDHFLNLD